ncbi:MAG: hypothetical protein DRQ49_15130 [Gammaproteobacteria bacterium]|nr:MAG: hypothetical protein DRQ49_15130 [Gammaproteobacteria bacterium]RKZ40418.1 MAG: hypothetical protein DRQ41_09420 [Gammaproteobacteria bacterium]RKZ75987.1 MAG: hypothetical protein DRQ57_05385 [Gammaproteobacteria bacterium]
MKKTQLIVISIISLFFMGQIARADYQEDLKAIKQSIDACLPVRPLPPILTLNDIKVLESTEYGPKWCRLLCQMGYLWPKPRQKSLPYDTQRAVANGKLAAERSAEQCLTRSAVKIHVIMKHRLIAYVGHQYTCDRLRDPEACRRARTIAMDFLYGAPTDEAFKVRKALKKLIDKGKECNTRDTLRQYCEQLGVKGGACNEL